MRISHVVAAVAALTPSIHAAALHDAQDLALVDARSEEDHFEERSTDDESLWKRKGGGGGGGRGGSSGSSGSSSGSRGGSTGSTGSSGGRGSSSSNTGGSTTTGSGVRPNYGGGRYYGGGAVTPYQSGKKSPGGILPFVLGGAALGFLGGAFLAGAYSYPWNHHYYFHNATTDKNETHPVYCICKKDGECSCDDNKDEAYFNSIIGDGSYENLNKSLVTTNFNETANETYIYIIGDLPNGTTAAGGSEDPNAAGGMTSLLRAAGWWPVATAALAIALS